MDIRSIQKPLKEQYRSVPGSSRITLHATGSQTDSALSCSVDLGRAIYGAQAHAGVGGAGTAACSGDLLLGALAACAQITAQLVATALGIAFKSIEVHVEGVLDLAGTLGISREVPVGFESIALELKVDAPSATDAELAKLMEKTEEYCVVPQTLRTPPAISHVWRKV